MTEGNFLEEMLKKSEFGCECKINNEPVQFGKSIREEDLHNCFKCATEYGGDIIFLHIV